MSICLVGLSHKTAPLDVRAQFAIAQENMAVTLTQLKHHTKAPGVMIISTCNRVEFICSHTTAESIIDWLALKHDHELINQLYCHHNAHAMAHAMSVSSGMDSLVLGEPQILGQFKEAYQTSKALGMLDSTLEQACQQVFHTAKMIRHETGLGQCPVSIASIASRIAKSHCQDFCCQRIVIVGAGDTAKLLCQHLTTLGAKNITIANRSWANAEVLAAEFKGKAALLTDLPALLKNADIVITATESHDYLIKSDMINADQHPGLMIDLSAPRNIDPAITEIFDIDCHCIDDLQNQISANTTKRKQALQLANKMIQDAAQAYQEALSSLNARDAICALRNHAESIRNQVLEQARQQLHAGTPVELVLEQLANRLTNKLLHNPSTHLKHAATSGNHDALQLIEKLYL